eukprot:2789209-Prymnesium_polylepis.1
MMKAKARTGTRRTRTSRRMRLTRRLTRRITVRREAVGMRRVQEQPATAQVRAAATAMATAQ